MSETISSKNLQKKILDKFLPDFINFLGTEKYAIVKRKTLKISDCEFRYNAYPKDITYYTYFDDVLLEESKEEYKKIENALLKMKHTYFYNSSNVFTSKFFNFLINENNLIDFWNLLDIKNKARLFDTLTTKYQGVKLLTIFDKLKPEEFGFLFRVLGEKYKDVEKASMVFSDKLKHMQKNYSTDVVVSLMNNLYNNVSNEEKNILTSIMKNESGMFTTDVKSKLDFTYVIEKNQIENTVDCLGELWNLNKLKFETFQLEIAFDRKMLSKIFQNLLSKENVDNLFKYIEAEFKMGDNVINTSGSIKSHGINSKSINTGSNQYLVCRVTNKNGFTQNEKEEFDVIFKKWFLKVISDDLMNILAPTDKSYYKSIGSNSAKQKMEEVISEIRQDGLFGKMTEKEYLKSSRKKI